MPFSTAVNNGALTQLDCQQPDSKPASRPKKRSTWTKPTDGDKAQDTLIRDFFVLFVCYLGLSLPSGRGGRSMLPESQQPLQRPKCLRLWSGHRRLGQPSCVHLQRPTVAPQLTHAVSIRASSVLTMQDQHQLNLFNIARFRRESGLTPGLRASNPATRHRLCEVWRPGFPKLVHIPPEIHIFFR
jgi:hypothetical protein